jgi:hypothetical protein
MAITHTEIDRTATSERGSRLSTVLLWMTALAVLLQGLWAGIFLEHDGHRDAAQSWIDVHARGAEVTIALAAAAAVTAYVRLRARRDLWIGATLLTVALVLEAYLGGTISDGHDAVTAVHVPLAMLVMGLAVWLPIRAAGRRHRS